LRAVLFFLFLLASFASARENPFAPPNTKESSGNESAMGEINKLEKLQSLTITPPVDAVKIKKITIEYQSVDGERVKKTYTIDKDIDPLKTFKVSQ
jgi:hypothetical protein